jgi:DNA polymerase-3 subunit epsilon
MTAWWSGRAVLLDFESDGVDPTDARIITACAALVTPQQAPIVSNFMLRTERPIPAEASAIHGVSTEYADAHGMPREDAVLAIADALAALARTGDTPVIGHNVVYDLTVLDREMRRLGIGSLGTEGDTVTVRIDGRTVGAFHVIDSLVLDKHVDPYRKGKRQLPTVAEHYGVPIRGDAHTASADALASGRIVWAIARRCGMPAPLLESLYADRRRPGAIVDDFHRLGRLSLPELHRAQVEMAAEQADGLREYFARNPDRGDPFTVTGDWPLQPVGVTDAVTDLV